MEKSPVTLYLDKDALSILQKIAERKDTSASKLIREMIRQYLAKEKRGPK